MTLALLWEEYRAGVDDGISYSWFCDLYRTWAGRLKPTMRLVHVAGEKLFVDFAGRTGTGEIVAVQIFVAVLGASSFTYAEATWSQKLPDWIAAHVRAFAYSGARGQAAGQLAQSAEVAADTNRLRIRSGRCRLAIFTDQAGRSPRRYSSPRSVPGCGLPRIFCARAI